MLGVDDAMFRSWIALKVSQILLQELHGLIDWITVRLIVKFDERTTIMRTTRGIVEVTRESNHN